MLSLSTNITSVINSRLAKLKALAPSGKVYQDAMKNGAEEALAASRDRIFAHGLGSDGSAIGVHSDGKPVMLSRTGHMRDSYQVLRSPSGYGLGWTDASLTDRAAGFERRYGKKIFSLSAAERIAFVRAVREYPGLY